MQRRLTQTLITFALLTAVLTPIGAQEDREGKTWFFIRMWPDQLVKFDPITDSVVQKISTRNGVCHGLQLTHDREHFLMITGQRSKIEVVRVSDMEIVEVHDFSEEGWIHRVSEIRELPGGEKWYVELDRVETKPDRYVIEKSQWRLYNVAEKKTEKKLRELPRAIRRGARLSPDGKKWHVFRNDIAIIDPETMKEEGKIELSKPLWTGLGPISVRGEDFFDNRNPDAYRFMYTMRDPVRENRTLFGLVDIDINERKVTNLTEWGANPSVWRFRLTEDRRLGIATKSSRDRGRQSDGDDPITTLVTYDMTNGKKVRETRVPTRNGLGLSAISPDGSKIYLTGRGHELVIHGADHQYQKTIELDGETDGRILVVRQ